MISILLFVCLVQFALLMWMRWGHVLLQRKYKRLVNYPFGQQIGTNTIDANKIVTGTIGAKKIKRHVL